MLSPHRLLVYYGIYAIAIAPPVSGAIAIVARPLASGFGLAVAVS